MNCQEALSLLYDVIDKEASEVDVDEVNRHLENCKHCLDRFEFESSLDDFMQARISNREVLPKLDALKSRVNDALDRVDAEVSPGGSGRFFSSTARVVTLAAASFVIMMGAAKYSADWYRHRAVYLPFERIHTEVVGGDNDFSSEPGLAQAVSHIRQRAQYDISSDVGTYTLIGGGKVTLFGANMCHFVYRSDGRIVSVFVACDEDFEIPSDLNDHRFSRHDLDFFDHNCNNCRLVFHRIGPAVVITATADREIDLLDFIPGRTAI